MISGYPVTSLAISGSHAGREQDEESNLDILAEFNCKIGIRFIDFSEELEKLMDFHLIAAFSDNSLVYDTELFPN